MEVILQQDYTSLGYIGDRVRVKGGYARNFLIPRGIALESSVHNEKILRHKLGGINAKKVRMRAEAQELATKLEALKLDFTLRVGAAGRTFGSVTTRDLEAALKKEGYVLDKKQIILSEPIKKGGEHKISVKLHSEVFAHLTVSVMTDLLEGVKPQADTADGEPALEEGKPAAKRKKAQAKRAEESGAPEEKAGDAKASRARKPRKKAEEKEAGPATAEPTEEPSGK